MTDAARLAASPAQYEKANEIVAEWDARAIHAVIQDGRRTGVEVRDLLRELIAYGLADAIAQALAEERERWSDYIQHWQWCPAIDGGICDCGLDSLRRAPTGGHDES